MVKPEDRMQLPEQQGICSSSVSAEIRLPTQTLKPLSLRRKEGRKEALFWRETHSTDLLQ